MTDIKEPTGIEGFRAWYRNHTGKMITRANAEKAVRSFASPPSPAPAESGAVAWLDLRTADRAWDDGKVVATNQQFVANNGPENFGALYLASSAPSASMGRVTVKKLEWHRFERGANSYFAHTLLGRYSAWDFDGIDGHYMPPDGYAGTRVDGGLEAAKAAAQAHFDSIILAALDSPPDHGGGEGWVLVPREPTPQMVAATAPHMELDGNDYAVAMAALDHLPRNDHPDIADVLAQVSRDYRSMIAAVPAAPTQESKDGR